MAAVCAAAAVGVAASPGADRVVQAAGEACIDTECGAGGEYHALTPARIFDSRKPAPLDVAPFGRKAMGPEGNDAILFHVPVVGLGGLPEFTDANVDGEDDNVLAVAVNITIVQPTGPGYVRAFGRDAPEERTALANFTANSVVPNSVIVISIAETNALLPGATGKPFERKPTTIAETIKAINAWRRNPAINVITISIPIANTANGQ